jgi:hypothetical protein
MTITKWCAPFDWFDKLTTSKLRAGKPRPTVLDLDFAAGSEEIEPFGQDFLARYGFCGLSIEVELLTIQLGATGYFISGHIIGFEIDNDEAFRCLDEQIDYALNDDGIVIRRSSFAIRQKTRGFEPLRGGQGEGEGPFAKYCVIFIERHLAEVDLEKPYYRINIYAGSDGLSDCTICNEFLQQGC